MHLQLANPIIDLASLRDRFITSEVKVTMLTA